MESNEEGDQSDQESHNLGVGRSYECVFCKRGFTTAQALGGHMNIHRKDRAKTKPISPSSSNKYEENYTAGPRFYQPIISTYPPHFAPSNEAQQLSYHTFFPSSTSGPGQYFYGNHHDNLQDGDQHHFDSFQDDWNMRLSSQYNPTLVQDMKKAVLSAGERSENDHLDLELRLGPDP